MKPLTERQVINAYLVKAEGDSTKALKLAVRDLGKFGYAISSGYIRAAPYDDVSLPHSPPPSVDIPEPDDDDE